MELLLKAGADKERARRRSQGGFEGFPAKGGRGVSFKGQDLEGVEGRFFHGIPCTESRGLENSESRYFADCGMAFVDASCARF